jgi:hypothetical protein
MACSPTQHWTPRGADGQPRIQRSPRRGWKSLHRSARVATGTEEALRPARRAGRKAAAVLDWIYRRRARMAAIYGRVHPGPLPGARFAGGAPQARPEVGALTRPGAAARRGRTVTLHPLPRRVDPAG